MADTAQDQRSQQDRSQQEARDDVREQQQFDSSFVNQLAGQLASQQGEFVPSALPGIDWAREYYDSVEQQIKTARRIAEVQAIHQMRQAIVSDVTQQVLKVLATAQVPSQRSKSTH